MKSKNKFQIKIDNFDSAKKSARKSLDIHKFNDSS